MRRHRRLPAKSCSERFQVQLAATHTLYIRTAERHATVCCVRCWGLDAVPRHLVNKVTIDNSRMFVSIAGVIKYLMQMYDLSAIQFRGASAGALISCLAACQARRNIPPEKPSWKLTHRDGGG